MATVVSFLLDETGSMNQQMDDTIGSFNSYIETLKEESDEDVEYRFSLKKFCKQKRETLTKLSPLSEVPELGRDNFFPGGSTPLVDASVNIIRDTQRWIEEEDIDPDNVIVTILTDGKENSSKENTNEDLSELVNEKEEEGWEFVFLGVDIDAYQEAGKYDLATGNTISGDREKLNATMDATARNTAKFASEKKQDMSYSDEQKEELED
jgi:hypothetical protein